MSKHNKTTLLFPLAAGGFDVADARRAVPAHAPPFA